MKRIVLASRNAKKVRELKELFDLPQIEILSLDDFARIIEVEEDGVTFEENACKKAREYARHTGCLTIADDSGLCVDHLDGRPGVFSARYAGEDKDDKANCDKVLSEMQGCPEPERTARFVAAIAIATPEQIIAVTLGTCEGFIATAMRGTNGFGYDPIFYYPAFGCTFGEIAAERKHRVSHRAEALHKAKAIVKKTIS
jgi:XTP/dITP diphosphohydrolase